MEITAEHARQALLNQGYDVSQITRIPEGSNHYVLIWCWAAAERPSASSPGQVYRAGTCQRQH